MNKKLGLTFDFFLVLGVMLFLCLVRVIIDPIVNQKVKDVVMYTFNSIALLLVVLSIEKNIICGIQNKVDLISQCIGSRDIVNLRVIGIIQVISFIVLIIFLIIQLLWANTLVNDLLTITALSLSYKAETIESYFIGFLVNKFSNKTFLEANSTN